MFFGFDLQPIVDTLDGAVTSVFTQDDLFCVGEKTIKAAITNKGNVNIDSLKVVWTVDGSGQTPVSYNQSLVPVDSSGTTNDTVTLGTITTQVSTDVAVKAWTYAPNSAMDSIPGNDTAEASFVSQEETPSVDSIEENEIGSGHFTFTAKNPENVAHYLWDYGDGSDMDTTEIGDHQYTSPGDYTVTLIVSNDCMSDTVTNKITLKTGIAESHLAKQLKAYPNPARDKVTFENESQYEMRVITVYNVLGQKVFQGRVENHGNKYQLDVRNYASGLYNVKIGFKNGDWVMRKFEVRK